MNVRSDVRDRSGFSLIELVVAMFLLSFLLLGVYAASGAQMIRTVGDADFEAVADNAARDRIDWIRADMRYGELVALYNRPDPENVEDEIGLPGATRQVLLRRIQDASDHVVVTVVIDSPVLSRPVSRTVAIAAP